MTLSAIVQAVFLFLWVTLPLSLVLTKLRESLDIAKPDNFGEIESCEVKAWNEPEVDLEDPAEVPDLPEAEDKEVA